MIPSGLPKEKCSVIVLAPLQLDQCDQQQDEEYHQTQWQ
jgi:hypothetical protein